jgi:fatty acid desaturase
LKSAQKILGDDVEAKSDQGIESQIRSLLHDLQEPVSIYYWLDLSFVISMSIALSILFFSASFDFPLGNFIRVFTFVFDILILYRGLSFIHEIAHFRKKGIRGFETAWNFFIGAPLLMPTIMYLDVHMNHHRPNTYGTLQDPEYLPFKGKPTMIFSFILQSLFIPLFLLGRFLILGPISLLFPRLEKFLITRATAFAMHFNYIRPISPALRHKVRVWQLVIIAMWYPFLYLSVVNKISWSLFIAWFVTVAAVSLINTLRALVAHSYSNLGNVFSRQQQIEDTVDTPDGFFAEIWAPVGLKYHALHHYFPNIPYHHLGEAYRRLQTFLPNDFYYRKTSSSSWLKSFATLLKK